MFYEEMQLTVDRAAALLPEPPCPGNFEGYSRWEALALDTGRQIARLVDADIGLLRTLMDDEFGTPVACRRRRRLLLRVALLAAYQPGKSEAMGLGASHHRVIRSEVQPTWLDAAS